MNKYIRRAMRQKRLQRVNPTEDQLDKALREYKEMKRKLRSLK